MNKQEQVEQLRLAALILEHDYEWESNDACGWRIITGATPIQCIYGGCPIRIKPPQPPTLEERVSILEAQIRELNPDLV